MPEPSRAVRSIFLKGRPLAEEGGEAAARAASSFGDSFFFSLFVFVFFFFFPCFEGRGLRERWCGERRAGFRADGAGERVVDKRARFPEGVEVTEKRHFVLRCGYGCSGSGGGDSGCGVLADAAGEGRFLLVLLFQEGRGFRGG